ncbi:MAG: sigma-70 family RNA polymerase sigma factor [Phycisphaerales bacterium]|nr:sigma-70 family RNA polymerase sigma factor [Phycisphaerales bacterium]
MSSDESNSVNADAGSAADRDTVTTLMHAAAIGDSDAANQLFPIVYDQLLSLARSHMRNEGVGHTLQATALVHEAYLRIIGSEALSWSTRAEFFRASANAMRRILIDYARRRGRVKRGGERKREPLDAVDLATACDPADVVALDSAVTRLAEIDSRAADVVQLRFYAGLSVSETAAALGMSERTVKREWAFARAWLYQVLEGEGPS